MPPKKRRLALNRGTRQADKTTKAAAGKAKQSCDETTNSPDPPPTAVDGDAIGPTSLNIFALGFEEVGGSASADKAVRGKNPAASSLQAKLASGRANENYIKVNIKKKTFSRGRRGGAAALRAEQRRKVDLKVGLE